MLELGKEKKDLGSQRAVVAFGKQVVRDRARMRPLAGGELRSSRCECSTPALVLLLGRRQPEGLLGELCRQRRRAAFRFESRRTVEQKGDAGVGPFGRKREVTSARGRIVDDLCDAGMDAAPFLPEAVVEGCRQQWMGEPNDPVVTLDDARGDCSVQRVRGDSRLQEQSL